MNNETYWYDSVQTSPVRPALCEGHQFELSYRNIHQHYSILTGDQVWRDEYRCRNCGEMEYRLRRKR